MEKVPNDRFLSYFLKLALTPFIFIYHAEGLQKDISIKEFYT